MTASLTRPLDMQLPGDLRAPPCKGASERLYKFSDGVLLVFGKPEEGSVADKNVAFDLVRKFQKRVKSFGSWRGRAVRIESEAQVPRSSSGADHECLDGVIVRLPTTIRRMASSGEPVIAVCVIEKASDRGNKRW